MSVREIEQAISDLEPVEFTQLAEWFARRLSENSDLSSPAIRESDLGPERTAAELAATYVAWATANPHSPENYDNSPLPMVRDGANW